MSDTKKTDEIKEDVKDTKKAATPAKADVSEKKTSDKSADSAKKTTDTTKKATPAKKTESAQSKVDKTGSTEDNNNDSAADALEDVSGAADSAATEGKSEKSDVETQIESTGAETAKVVADKMNLRTVKFRGFTPVYMHPNKNSACAKVQGVVFVSGKTAGNFAEILAMIPGLGKTKCYVEKQRVGVK